jgi:SAM-dependent methyltransferase
MLEFDPESKTCLVCGGTTLRRFSAQASDAKDLTNVSVVECASCVFAWQYPLLRTENESVDWFDAAYTDQGVAGSEYFNLNRKREIARLELEFAEGLGVRKKTLLDVGAGAGIFAQVAAEKDWRVTAVDPALAIDGIRDNPKINGIRGPVGQVPNGERYGLITLWDVIEHAAGPIELISSAAQYIETGGWLVIETGNYKSTNRVRAGVAHWIYQLDHRWYFSPESMRRVLEKLGFCEFKFSDKMLRPGQTLAPERLQLRLIKSIGRNPMRLSRHLSNYFDLVRAQRWEMSDIDIFTVAARKASDQT